MNHTTDTDLAVPADRPVAEAIAIPPDDLPDDYRAYMAWLRDPKRPARRPRPRLVHPAPEVPAKTRPQRVRDPEYDQAAAELRRLPDLGAASLQAARAALGDDATLEQLVIHAARNPVAPDPGTTRNSPEHNGTRGPVCGCGTALDPDGACFTCATMNTSRDAATHGAATDTA